VTADAYRPMILSRGLAPEKMTTHRLQLAGAYRPLDTRAARIAPVSTRPTPPGETSECDAMKERGQSGATAG